MNGKGQISVDAISYLLAMSSLVIAFLFAGYSILGDASGLSEARNIRLASAIGDTILLNPELGMVGRDGPEGKVRDHVIDFAKSLKIERVEYSLSIGGRDIRKGEAPNWCAKRAGVVNGKVEVIEVCV